MLNREHIPTQPLFSKTFLTPQVPDEKLWLGGSNPLVIYISCISLSFFFSFFSQIRKNGGVLGVFTLTKCVQRL